MKNSAQIMGLPIICIADGQEIGAVKSLVINPEKGSIDFLTIEHEDWQVSVKAIPFKKVIGIGEYAVTIESESAVIDLNEIPITNQLVNKKIKIINTKVMTRKGQLLGEVQEYFVNDETGDILGMQLTVAGRDVVLRSKFVLTYGKDILIVTEDAEASFQDSVNDLEHLQPAVDVINSDEIDTVISTQSNVIEDLIGTVETDPFSGLEIEAENQEYNDELLSLKEKQIELLAGKKVTKDIYDMNGDIFVNEGTILDAETISKAQEEGPNIVVELSMNVEV